jgi:glycosyltransferase involved in cell wall biosynthesis
MSKIAIIHSIYKPDTRGGAEVVVESIARGLKEKNEDVFVIAVGRENKKEDIDGVKVYRIKPFNLFNFLDINQKSIGLRFFWHIWDMFNDVQAWRVYKVLRDEKPDVVMTHNLKGLGYYIPWLLKIMKIDHIHTVHDAQLLHPSGLTDSEANLSFLARFYAWSSRRLFGSPRVVIFPSKYSQEIYNKWGFFKESERVVLGNPVNIGGVKTGKTKNSKLNLLFLGQVEEYKGIMELIQAIKRLKKENDKLDIVLHVVGSGGAFNSAKEAAGSLLDETVMFYGRLDSQGLESDIWPKIDILVNPTKVPESFGMVVLEAFSHGVPVIASRMGALPELVSDDCGFLVKSGNVDELKDKIKFILDNQNILASMSKNCSEKVKEYDIEVYLTRLAEYANLGFKAHS